MGELAEVERVGVLCPVDNVADGLLVSAEGTKYAL